jgi:superfamily II DNA or RNA helicase
MRELLQAIRESCSPGTWSRGVELARSNSVVGEADEGDEVVLRVMLSGGQMSPQVVLFPDDEDWTCDCNSKEDACAHVAAAAIALKQARDAGQALPGGEEGEPAHVGYRMASHGHRLLVRRVVAHPERDEPIEGSVAQVKKRLGGAKFIVTEPDLQFEKRFGTVAGGVIARERLEDVLHALRDVGDLTLDGKPVDIGPPASGLCVHVHDVGEDVRVVLEQDPAIEKVWDNGAMLRAGRLFPLGEHGLGLSDFDTYREGRTFAPEDLGTLVSDVLPRLKRRLPVRIETKRLPETRTMLPRLSIVSTRHDDALQVMATIVYGDPAVARVDGDRLTLLSTKAAAPLRNLPEEKKLRRQLADRLHLEPGIPRAMPAGEALRWNQRVAKLGDVGFEGGAHLEFYEAGPLSAELEIGDEGQFDVWFGADASGGGSTGGGGTGRVDPRVVLRAWERGEDLVPLLEGGFGRVPTEWLAQHGARVLALLDAKAANEGGEAPAWAMPDLAALCEALDEPPPPQLSKLRALVDGFDGLAPVPPPGDLTANLRDYQRHGVAWLSFLRSAGLGALLADDMGLGKTLQALCAVQGRSLVVAPTSVLPNWAAEIEKFRPGLRVDVYHGSGRALDPTADVTLTTYALLRLDIEALLEPRWATVILDEAQAIKNPDSQVTRAAYRLSADFRIAMTGTPVENRLEDLWSQLHFANPGLLGGRSDFQERWASPIAAGDEETAAALRQRISPFVLRRRKQEVAKELPPRTDVVLHCELRDEERATYDAVRAATQSDVAARFGAGDSVLKILEALLRLRQAACHPGLLPGRDGPPPLDSSKLALLAERLEIATEAGHKALVFSQWTSLLDLVEPVLQRSGIPFIRLDGSTRDRGAVVEAFQDPAGPPVMLISLRAGGTGLNLTAADQVYLLDPWWNPAVEDQAADRAHRIGQERPVLVHRLVARDTVEERILALQDRKRALAESAVQGGAAAGISRDELLSLLS